jgi:hypothetical protein
VILILAGVVTPDAWGTALFSLGTVRATHGRAYGPQGKRLQGMRRLQNIYYCSEYQRTHLSPPVYIKHLPFGLSYYLFVADTIGYQSMNYIASTIFCSKDRIFTLL